MNQKGQVSVLIEIVKFADIVVAAITVGFVLTVIVVVIIFGLVSVTGKQF